MLTRISRSAVIDAPVAEVWGAIRNFNALPSWHPMVARSSIEDGGAPEAIGCVRNYSRHDGLVIRERLLAMDDRAYTCAYELLDPPIPVKDYVAWLSLRPVTESRATYAEWIAEFACDPEKERELVDGIGEVFAAGFRRLNEMFSEPASRPRATLPELESRS